MREKKIHELKTWPEYFEATWYGRKPFEVRVNDRDYQVGDELVLKEYDPDKDEYSGQVIKATIGYILHGGQVGIPENLCVMSLIGIRLEG